MRTPYDADGLAGALAGLPGWTGDVRRIARDVVLPPDLDTRLRAEVAAVADEVDHHPVLEDLPGGGTRYVLWTHVRDAVTEQDTALAGRISALVEGLVEGLPDELSGR